MISLPEPLQTYFDAAARRDLDGAVDSFTHDAEVADEGRTHQGRADVQLWLEDVWGKYSYTTEVTGVRPENDDQWVVFTHLKGDFPGGEADLAQHFTLRDGLIAALGHAPVA